MRSNQPLAGVAEKHQLDPQRLTAWITHLKEAKTDPHDPLHLWAVVAHDAKAADTDHLQEIVAGVVRQWQTQDGAVRRALAGADVIVDFTDAGDDDWMQDGVSFGVAPHRPGELQLGDDADSLLSGVMSYGALRRDPLWNGLKLAPGNHSELGKLSKWNRAGRTVRTKTFAINRKAAYYLVRGVGHAYAVVDSHRMINGPLHGALMKEIDAPQRHTWIAHDLSRYQGHGAHLEFIAKDDQPLEVLAVVQADEAPGNIDHSASRLLMSTLAGTAPKSLPHLAQRYQQLLSKVCQKLPRNQLTTTPDPAAGAALADWMLRNPQLLREASQQQQRQAAALFADYRSQRKKLTDHIIWQSYTALAMWDGNGVDERLLVRGNPRTPGDAVPRGLPAAIGGPRRPTLVSGSGRLELARRLVDETNPLTARVMVNRVWHHLFGRGIVASVDNFGVLGGQPTHPQLLDHLADRFMREGWSLKQLIRSIVLSRAYRMSSYGDPAAVETDPQNLLLHQMPIRRLEAEAVRDAILAVSGRLDKKLFGPSVDVYLTPFMQGRGRPKSGPLDGGGRRSIYVAVRRNFLAPMMLAFDAPIPFMTMGRRNVSNVPAQALTLMNDPLVVEQSRLWAARVLKDRGASTQERITSIYETAFARPPNDEELAAAEDFLATQARELGLTAEMAKRDPRVWADLCHVLMNAKEFIFIQ